MNIVGIDPGLEGGLVLLGERLLASRMPTREREIDGAAVARWLLFAEPDLVVVERLTARNTFDANGKAIRRTGAEFRFATGYGVLQGVLQAMALDYWLVTPQAWKRRILADTDWSKAAAITHIQATLPDLELIPKGCRVPQDGLADAACLALYGRYRMERRKAL